MRRFWIFLTLLFLLRLTAYPQEILHKENQTAVKINEYFTELAKQQKFNGNVLVGLGNTIILKKNYNISPSIGGLRSSVRHQFMIASVAKLFVKYAFLKLEEQRKIRLDDPIGKFIQDFPNGEKITVQHLIDHTSGLPRELMDREKLNDVTLEKVVQLARKEKLQFEPGTDTLYSNVGYQMLLYILGKAAPGGYERFVRKNLLQPFGMSNTYEYNYKKPRNFAKGFVSRDKKISPADEAELRKFESGRFYSTIDDMGKFSRGLLNPRRTSTAILDQMLNKNGEVVHAGAIDGYKSYFLLNTKTGLTYIFLSNYADITLVQMSKDVPEIVAGRAYRLPRKTNRIAIELNENILNRYVGTYALKIDRNQTVEFKAENGKLYILEDNGTKTELFAERETVFFSDPQKDDVFEFVWDKEAKTYTLFLTVEGGIRLEAIKLN